MRSTEPLQTLKIDEFIKELNPIFNVKAVISNTPDTQVWSITTDIEAAQSVNSTFLETVLGFPRNIIRWFALVRLWTPWLAPRQGQLSLDLDKDALLCSFLRSDGLNFILLAVSGIDDVAREIVREYGGMSEELSKEVKSLIENDVKTEWMENWYDGLSYCTWNGLGQKLTETKILEALESLERNNVKS